MSEASHERPFPGPQSRLSISDTLFCMRDQLGYMLHMRQQHGTLVRLPLAPGTFCLVSDPALIEQVYIGDSKSYIKDMGVRLIGRELLGQGLFTSDGDTWRRQRRLSQPAFHRERIVHYAGVMATCAQEYAGSLRVGEQRNLLDDILTVALQIVLRTLLSIEDPDTAAEIKQAIDTVLERHAKVLLVLFPTLMRLPLSINRRFAQAKRTLDRHVLHIIAQRRAEQPKKSHDDLLSMLIAARDEDQSGMTDAQLRDEVLTIFVAGYETTSLLVYYAFLLLSQNPQAQAALDTELATVLAGRAPTFHDLPALRYTEAVLLESLRLYPPAWIVAREAARDTELGGHKIGRGTQLWMSPWVMHRDPTFFPQPEVFRPERWLDGLQKRLPRFVFMPFGGGPRQCIGNAFAMTEATLLLSTIAGRFRLRLEAGPQPMRFDLAVSLHPRHKLRAHVEPHATDPAPAGH